MEHALLLALIFILVLMLGFIIGYVLAASKLNRIAYGVLHLETSDPDGMQLFLELHPDAISAIQKRDYITLKVDTKSYISQK